MKKIFTFLAVAAVATSATSCGSLNSKEIDSLSYAIGADLGMNITFGMADFDLDRNIIIDNIESFYKSGDIEGEELQEVRTKMMEYQYTLLMPYMNAKRINDMVQTDCPDTLPALPECFNEEYTREYISELMGTNMGAMVKSVDADIKIRDVIRAIEDINTLESVEQADSLLRLTQLQMREAFMKHSQQAQEKARAEFEKAKVKNTEESEKWLAEVEKEIESIILSVNGVSSPHHLRTRRIGNNYAIEVHIRMDGNMTLHEAHKVTTTVEQRLKQYFGPNTHVGIHTEPVK